jgi:ATP-dependent helicase HrpA
LQRSIDDPDLDEYRWMLEEYRVSLFAQTLGTSMKVSPQRLARQWAKVR